MRKLSTTSLFGRIGCKILGTFLVALLLVGGITVSAGFAAEKTAKEKDPASAQEPVSPDAAKEPSPTTLTVTLQDEDGLPIVGVNLSAVAADFSGRVMDRATTDKEGKAVFKRLKSGAYYFFGNINALHKHDGYASSAMVRDFKTTRSYYISESQKFDLSDNAEATYTIKRRAFVMFESYLQVVRSEKFVIINQKYGIEQVVPMASIDYLRVYMPMRQTYQIVTIKDNDFDSWILEIFAHEAMRIELL